MRLISLCTLVLLLTTGLFASDWNWCAREGLIPFWVNAGDFYTLLVFINAHDDTPDIIHIRFCDDNGNFCSDTTADMWSIRHREQLLFSTRRQKTPRWIPTTADYGYVKFRTEGSGLIYAWAIICSDLSGASMVVPTFNQYSGF